MMKLTKRQHLIYSGLICPYCGNDSKHVHGPYGWQYECEPCRAHVGCHKNDPKKALGRLANRELRRQKMKAHGVFDTLWVNGYMSRQGAYNWLSQQLGLPPTFTHIGMFNMETCKKVITLTTQYIKQIHDNTSNKRESVE